MANTDAHLPVTSSPTPAFILEVDQAKQFNEWPPPGSTASWADDPRRSDESADNRLADPLVLRRTSLVDRYLTNGADTNYLRLHRRRACRARRHLTGNDILISGNGNDTLYGDGGNDRLEGGNGNDIILGGAGDDIITDIAGDDVLQGKDGNDAIQGGNGLNLILGGFGNDFIVSGKDASQAFGGAGNDFILAAAAKRVVIGNEGDDWLEAAMPTVRRRQRRPVWPRPGHRQRRLHRRLVRPHERRRRR